MTPRPAPLTYADIATMTGLTPATLRGYRANGYMPEPDASPVPDRPAWRPATIAAWIASRPGRGAPGQPRQRKANEKGSRS